MEESLLLPLSTVCLPSLARATPSLNRETLRDPYPATSPPEARRQPFPPRVVRSYQKKKIKPSPRKRCWPPIFYSFKACRGYTKMKTEDAKTFNGVFPFSPRGRVEGGGIPPNSLPNGVPTVFGGSILFTTSRGRWEV